MNLLPFNFAQLSNDKFFISNFSGAFTYLENRCDLENIISLDLKSLDSSLVNQLVAKNFISDDSEVDLRASLLSSALATHINQAISSPSLFMVVPTLRCDHDCGYCQVSRVPLNKVGYDADDEIIGNIVEFISAKANKSIKIEFQGGEPLLAFEYIRKFYDVAQSRLAEVDVSYVICTATGPLDDSIINWAADKKVVFSVSLDGPDFVHNDNRPSKYFNAHKVTSDSIIKIRENLASERVSCICTVSRFSLDFPHQIVDSYREFDFESIFLRSLSPFGFAAKSGHFLGYSVQEFMGFYKKALDYIIKLNENYFFIEECALIHLKKIFQPHRNGYIDLQSPAGYIFGAVVFNYDGKVFGSDEARMLWQTTKIDELVLDDLSRSDCRGDEDSSVTILKSSFSCLSPGCADCAFLPYCGSDPMFHLATQGDSVGDKSFSFFCNYQKAMFDHLLVLWDSNPAARRVFESWLFR